MPYTTVHPEGAPMNAAAFLLAAGPRRVIVGLVRLFAGRIENGGRAPPPLDIDLAIRRLPEAAFAAKTRKVYAGAGRGTGQVRGVSWKEAEKMCLAAEALEGPVHAGALHTQPGGGAGRRGAAARRCQEKVGKSACGVRNGGGTVWLTLVNRMILLLFVECSRQFIMATTVHARTRGLVRIGTSSLPI